MMMGERGIEDASWTFGLGWVIEMNEVDTLKMKVTGLWSWLGEGLLCLRHC